MRIGVTLPEVGPLAAVEPLAAAVRAADQLGYDAVWARTAAGLLVAATTSTHLPLGLLAADPTPADAVALVADVATLLDPRLAAVIVDTDAMDSAKAVARGARVLGAGNRPPPIPGNGWAPRWDDRQEPDLSDWSGPLVVRVDGARAFPLVAELLVDPGPLERLDELLACWAGVAERREWMLGAARHGPDHEPSHATE